MTQTSSNIAQAAQSSANPSDPYNREQQIFPKLSDEQMDRLVGYGSVEHLPAGTVLFQRGDRRADFFLILDGNIEIFDLDDHGEPIVFTTHAKSQFTGELDLFNDRQILVGGRTGVDSRVARLTRAQFNRMYSTEQDIGEVIMRAYILRRTAFILHDQAGVSVVGEPTSREFLRIQRFLTRNGYPFAAKPTGEPGTTDYAELHDIDLTRLPAVRTRSGTVHYAPTIADLADELGLTEAVDAQHIYDLAVIGAGPAGLSACVYAASENIDTIVVEAEAPGGQAGTSSKIENYLGFPTGISGQALAGRAWIQGQKFGAKFAIARAATAIAHKDGLFEVKLQHGMHLKARSIILACGATYRTLDLPDYEKYEGQGIHYAATGLEAQLCVNEEVAVIGGGNSAGQAAVFLSGHASHVHVLVRSEGLAASMSDYLVQRIEQSSRITLHPFTEVTELKGDRSLRKIVWKNSQTGESEEKDIGNIFVMIGAVPNTAWMGDCVDLDKKGFVLAGLDIADRQPKSPFSTSVDGIFAVGDVRSGSVKRVASGVGEGSVCVSAIHGYLADNPV
ncbi:MAG: FAD-dependent oxidoreductase [Pseudomonadota bacterium]